MQGHTNSFRDAPISGVQEIGLTFPADNKDLLSLALMGKSIASMNAGQGVAKSGSGGILGSLGGLGVYAVDGDGLNLQV